MYVHVLVSYVNPYQYACVRVFRLRVCTRFVCEFLSVCVCVKATCIYLYMFHV